MTEPYELAAEGPDLYRCFVIPDEGAGRKVSGSWWSIGLETAGSSITRY